MAKRFILAVATLAIVVVLFAVYHTSTVGPDQYLDTAPRVDTSAFGPRATSTAPSQTLSVGGVEIPAGDQVRFQLWDEEGQLRAWLSAAVWEPLGNGDEVRLEKPEVEIVLPGTQIAHITADRGHVTMQPGGKGKLDPKSGRLEGHVHIYIDRSTREMREADPDRADPAQRPDDLVHVWMEEVTFDLDLSRLESAGTFRVQSAEADIEGVGLTLRWNETSNQIEDLRIDKVVRMVLRKGGDLFRFELPGADRLDDSAGRRSTAMAAANVTAAGSSAVPLVPGAPVANRVVELPPRPRPVRRPTPVPTTRPVADPARLRTAIQLARLEKSEAPRITTYRALFEGPVKVEQRSGLEVLASLTSDDLAIVFDFSERRRKQAAATPTSQPTANVAVGNTSGVREDPDEPSIVLTSAGPFTLRSVPGEQASPAGPERFRVEATGDPVRIEQAGGRARGRKLIYEQHTDRAWIEGDAQTPAVLVTADGRELQAEKLFFDRKVGRARITGPGHMTDIRELAGRLALPGAPADEGDAPDSGENSGFRISWTDGVELTFQTVRVPIIDPAGGPRRFKSRDVPKRATFRGDVKLAQGDRSLSADRIELRFAPPRSSEAVVDTLSEILAEGRVEMAVGRGGAIERIRCRRLMVEMTVDADGENIPLIARAIGEVRAEQLRPASLLVQMQSATPQYTTQRFISADDQLVVRFGKFRRPGKPFDLAEIKAAALEIVHDPNRTDVEKARALAKGIGEDPNAFAADKGVAIVQRLRDNPDAIDWNALRSRFAERSTIGIVSMHASGDVEARETNRADGGLEMQAETLEVTLEDGRTIVTVRLTGTRERMAVAAIGDYLIRGQRIDANLPDQRADVDGAGELVFTTAESFDGRKRDEPTPVTITWQKRMILRGQQNFGIFEGRVEAHSENSELHCEDRLRVDLVATPPKRQADVATSAAPARGFWLLRPFLTRRSDSKEAFRPFAGRFDKRIVRLVAKGAATILSSDIDAQTGHLRGRTLIVGPQIEVDLDHQRLNVVGEGSLLIEDYRLPAPSGSSRVVAAAPTGATLLRRSMDGGGPSQTLIQWTSAMSFFVRSNVASFDRGVRLTHLAGSEMKLATEIARAMNVDPAALQHVESRHATLTADDYLTVTFARRPDAAGRTGMTDRLGSVDLEHFAASGNVHLVVEKTNTLRGERIVYSSEKDQVTVEGGAGTNAVLTRHDPATGAFMTWNGPVLYWWPSTDRVVGPNATIVSSGG